MANMQTIDFTPFMIAEGATVGHAPTPHQLEVAAQIDAAFRASGFLFIDGLGVSLDELASYYHMSAMLFALPEEHKKTKLKQLDRHTNRGYAAKGTEALNSRRAPDLKEIYNVANPTCVTQDFNECPPGFGDLMTDFWGKMMTAGRNFAIACAIALDLPRDSFVETLTQFNQGTIRLLCYPPCDYVAGKSTGDDLSASLRVGEHTDFGMFTFLYCDSPGLQVKAVEGGEIGGEVGGEPGGWLDVPVPREGTAIVNTGALMARWTNDTWRATAHRVVVSNPLQAMSHRFSMTCFVDPDEDAVVAVDPKFVQPGEKAKYEPITGKEYLDAKLALCRAAHE